MKKMITCILATIGLLSACGQKADYQTDVSGISAQLQGVDVRIRHYE